MKMHAEHLILPLHDRALHYAMFISVGGSRADSIPASRSSTAANINPPEPSTMRKRRPERTFARVIIWASASGRRNKTRLGSLSNQYWQTLNIVGSIISIDLENLEF